MNALSQFLAGLSDPDTGGWNKRLWLDWALANAVAYTVILLFIYGMETFSLDESTTVDLKGNTVAQLLVATVGALIYGVILGRLQWRVIRERVAIPRRSWVVACVVPALISWVVIVVPAATNASGSDGELRTAYFLAVSQALALGPLLGISQAKWLRPHTRRWAWWIGGNIASYLVVGAVFYVLSLVFSGFDFTDGRGSPLEAYIALLLTTPLSGRILLWVTAPSALTGASKGFSSDQA